MADKERENKILPPKVPKPNYQMWIILALVAVILAVTYFTRSGELIEIQSGQFKQMVESNDVSKVVLFTKEQLVEITLKAEALQNTKYKSQLEENNALVGAGQSNGPHFKLKIGSVEKFQTSYDEIKKKNSQAPDVQFEPEERTNISSMLIQWGFLFLLLFGFWMLMRRMTGGGGTGGQIFNIGKSKAALFDAENKVKITFQDVAGLDEAKEEVKEIVDFLKTPGKFTKLGGKIPKGCHGR